MKHHSSSSSWISRFRRHEAYFILTVGVLCTVVSSLWSHLQLEKAETNLLVEYESKVADRFNSKLDSYLALLLQTKSFLEINPEMSETSFRKYMSAIKLADLYPGLPYVGYVAAEVEQGRLVRAQVKFAEPASAIDQNLKNINLSEDPHRRLAMVKAAALGEPSISGFLSKLPELSAPSREGFIIYLPVYDELAAGGLQLKGFVYSPFSAQTFLSRVFSALPDLHLPLRAEVHLDGLYGDRLVFRTIQGGKSETVATGTPYPHLKVSRPLQIGNQGLVLELIAVPGFLNLWSRTVPLVILVLGGLLSFLFFLLVRTEKEFSQIVQDQKNEIELITDAVPILIGYISKDRRFTFLNRAHHVWCKKPRRPIVGRSVVEILGTSYYEKVRKNLDRAFTGERLTFRSSYQTRKANDKHYEATLVPDMNSKGQIEGVFFSAYDISEAVLFTERVKQSEERLRLINQATNDVIWEWDLEADTVSWNEQTLEKFGYMRHEIGTSMQWWKDHIHPEDLEHTLKQMGSYKEGASRQWQVEYRFRKANGEYAYVIDRGTLLQSTEGFPAKMVGAMMDLTELRQAEKDLARAKEVAEKANGAKTAFLANMSHEIRTPLWGIIGFTELCLEERPRYEDRRVWLNKIKKNGLHLLSLIDEILDISKVEAGKFEVGSESFSLESLLRDVNTLLTTQAMKKGVELKFNSFQSLPKKIISDEKRLKQILVNLVGNSIKFTPSGRIDVSVYIRPGAPDQLVFEVRDSGIGMSEEQAKKLFTPFSQADSSISRKYGGTGLGLVLSRELCHRLGGDLKLLWSAPEQGSLFEAAIELNVDAEAGYLDTLDVEENYQSGHEEISARGDDLRGCRILLAEDSEDNQLLITRFLGQTGAKLDVASNGQEAIEKASEHHYDMVLMDIQMPMVDGYAATRTLREQGHTEPILALTAHAFREERLRCYDAGCNDHLTKPIARAELVSKIQAHLGREWRAPKPGASSGLRPEQLH